MGGRTIPLKQGGDQALMEAGQYLSPGMRLRVVGTGEGKEFAVGAAVLTALGVSVLLE
ncbi:MAG: hypothetical protein ABDH20_12075 [Thermus sp.]